MRCNGATATTEPLLNLGWISHLRAPRLDLLGKLQPQLGAVATVPTVYSGPPRGEHSGAQPMPEGVPYRPLAKLQPPAARLGVLGSAALGTAPGRALRPMANAAALRQAAPRPPRCPAGMSLAPLGQRAARCPYARTELAAGVPGIASRAPGGRRARALAAEGNRRSAPLGAAGIRSTR